MAICLLEQVQAEIFQKPSNLLSNITGYMSEQDNNALSDIYGLSEINIIAFIIKTNLFLAKEKTSPEKTLSELIFIVVKPEIENLIITYVNEVHELCNHNDDERLNFVYEKFMGKHWHTVMIQPVIVELCLSEILFAIF